jgi:hypothetical protein
VTPITSRDPWLRRFEKDAFLACLAMAGAALMVRTGNPDVALGVLGGGLLAAFSYWAIKGGVDAGFGSAALSAPSGETTSAADPKSRRTLRARVLAVAKFIGRYALLAVAAYVMLTRLRLHPVGMLVGVSAPVVAAAVLVVRLAARRP